ELTDPETMTQFDLSKPPLSSLSLIRTNDDSHHVVWTFHHIILDGWSLPLLLRELLTIYSAFCRGEQPDLPPARAYKDYIAWLQDQDLAEAESHWQKTLAGFTRPTVVKPGSPVVPSGPSEYLEAVLRLSPDLIEQMHAVARKRRLTVSTLLQGAWAIALSHFSGSADVLFGVVASGRPTELAGVDRMVGMFINTLPLRVEIRAESPASDLLLAIQGQQVQSRQYEYCPITQIQQWSRTPRGTQLFQYVLLFQNYPAGTVNEPLPDGLRLENIRHIVRDNFPLVLSVGQQMILHLQYDRHRIGTATAEAMLAGCERIFQEIARDPDLPVQKLYRVMEEVEKQFKLTGLQQAEKAAAEKLRLRARSGTARKVRAGANPDSVESYE
ncbi:MAG TPA: condensation domain-containing protein, partial [Blastocatellia bacterium]|nr:condensation domain-containing protein [Blastocatellia bacterium]